MKFTYAALAAAALFAGTSVEASSALIYEPFSQPAGSLNGATAGTGLSGNWSINQTVNVVTPPTLSYGDLQNAGGQAVLTNGNGTDAWVTTSSVLADNNLLDDGATVWFSFMLNKASGGGTNEWSGFAFGTDRVDASFNGINMTNNGNGLGIATRGNSLNVSTWEGGGNASQGSGLSYTLGESILVVGNIQWGATAADVETITLYNPSTTDLGTLGSSVSKSTTAGVDQSAFDTISIGIRNSGGNTIYDEIRFGATLESVTPSSVVIPSPSALGGGLAMLGLIAARRRRGA